MLESRSNNIIIFGYSGHSYVVIDALILNNINIFGYYDIVEHSYNPYQLKYFGTETIQNLDKIPEQCSVFPSLGSNSIREKLVTLFQANNLSEIVIIHPKSYVSIKSEIENSTFIGASAVINPLVKIGKGCIINTASVIEHECVIGNYTHIAPGAVLAGNVTIGKNCFIGANSVIKQGVIIGDNVTIGAGSVVIKNIPESGTYVGTPINKIK